jgi:hypothetical protein
MMSSNDSNESFKQAVIFLDIDGVLNTLLEVKELSLPLDRDCVKVLNHVIEQSQAKVVISSIWRLYYKLDEIGVILKRFGFEGQIIGRTPEIKGAVRGEEIKTWLQIYGDAVDRFVILDDRNDMADLKGQLVQTMINEGMTARHGRKALKVLGF